LKNMPGLMKKRTCNIGVIHGGLATNIVPDLVEIQSDVRSRNLDKLAAQRGYLVITGSAGVGSQSLHHCRRQSP